MDRFPPGTIFGNEFRIVRLLREGGMGAVYVAEQLSTGRQRALKVLAAELGEDAGARERFVREARIGAQIDSDHVVEVVTAGVDATTGCPYLVMELLVGLDLDDVAEQFGPLPLGDTAEIMAQVGHALERAHALSIVHRDIKPANIFLAAPRRRGSPFTVKVLDFGIAKAVADNNKLTGAAPLGTPLYMAPEQMEHAGQVTPAADVWAIGLVVFRLLTGRDLWRSSDDSFPTLVREIVVDELPVPSKRAPELGAIGLLPHGFDEWFAFCVSRSPQGRFANAGEAIAAFHSLVPPGTPTGRLADWLHTRTGSVADSGSRSYTGGSHQGVSTPGQWSSQGGVPARSAGHHPPPSSGTPSQGAFGPVSVPVRGSPSHSSPPTGDGATQYSQPLHETTSAKPVAAAPRPQRSSRALLLVGGFGALAALGGAYFAFGQSGRQSTEAASQPSVRAASIAVSAVPAPRCPADMVLVSGGSMFMGDLDLENARPPHKVNVPTFCVDSHEVTAAAYDSCVEHGNCLKSPQDVHFTGMTEVQRAAFSELCNTRREGRGEHPANCVDWSMADNFCRTQGGRLADGGARLPTEAEWEFAARGSGQKAFPWGDEPPDATRLNACGSECEAWFVQHKLTTRTLYTVDDGFPGTAPVGSFPKGATREGVVDLAGNVWEWTGDWYGPYTGDAASNPKGAEAGTERVVRGGSFNGAMSAWAKPAYRWKTTPDVYNHAIGFRCATGAS